MGKMGDKMRADMARLKEEREQRDAERHAKNAERMDGIRAKNAETTAAADARLDAARAHHEDVKADRRAKLDELAEDRKDRTLGGWGRKRKP